MEPDFWNTRYGVEHYVYGTEPNAFVAQSAGLIPAGPVLCLAEGEGRNAVFLASRGHAVTAVDRSAVGLGKARRLAATKGVEIRTQAVDLAEYDLGREQWAGIVATFAHLPSRLRRQVHGRVVGALAPGGVVILEAYTQAQLARDTGGPKDPDMLMGLEALRGEFAGLELVVARELEREVVEGEGHTGLASVVQLIGRKRQA